MDKRILQRLKTHLLCLKGFSLTEIAVAMAVATVAMVTILGLLPAGLTTMRAAMDQTIEAQIVRQVTSEILLTPFSQIQYYSNAPMYFDNEGQRLDAPENSFYRAYIAVTNAVYPNAPAATTNVLRAVNILVVSSPVIDAPLSRTNRYTVSVSYNGY